MIRQHMFMRHRKPIRWFDYGLHLNAASYLIGECDILTKNNQVTIKFSTATILVYNETYVFVKVLGKPSKQVKEYVLSIVQYVNQHIGIYNTNYVLTNWWNPLNAHDAFMTTTGLTCNWIFGFAFALDSDFISILKEFYNMSILQEIFNTERHSQRPAIWRKRAIVKPVKGTQHFTTLVDSMGFKTQVIVTIVDTSNSTFDSFQNTSMMFVDFRDAINDSMLSQIFNKSPSIDDSFDLTDRKLSFEVLNMVKTSALAKIQTLKFKPDVVLLRVDTTPGRTADKTISQRLKIYYKIICDIGPAIGCSNVYKLDNRPHFASVVAMRYKATEQQATDLYSISKLTVDQQLNISRGN